MEYDTKEKIAPLGILTEEFKEVSTNQPSSQPSSPSPSDRALMDAARIASQPPATPTEYSIKIPMRDGHLSEARVHKPPSSSPGTKTPLLVLLFGGGFMFGDCDQLTPYARLASSLLDITVLNLSYRRAPEHPFPTAPHDVWDAVQWITRHADTTLDVDLPSGFVIGGISAGGNLAAVTAQKTLDHNLSPPLTGVWLSIPWLLEPPIVPPPFRDVFFSREQAASAPGLDRKAMDLFNEAYAPELTSADFSPFNSATAHAGMPPTFVQVCGADPLRDDGLIYARALRERGVDARVVAYAGVPHLFPDFFRMEAFQKFHFDVLEGLARLFGREVGAGEIEAALADSPFAPEV
ncbi:hypothetical protein CkaCkLH20_01919 [Colletotrichum karsti]|uniref:Alpha/beta hydrolase fold-3 domain-containing protein n=1 Tax=Colletotrichum karsti TaxID=1095194 RepID=A0A9P6LQM0_9PEZI|nr:uncharacterized protein CkaCkLH20_01919 [Colletotrichum karsti]KAF9880877.1 hypothetical protein CkaCkLH20_01919 [Colletotrichum karsti]